MNNNPYQPTLPSTGRESVIYSVLWFAVASCVGLNAYVAMDLGFRFAISDVLRNPVDWLGPSCVFAVVSTPIAVVCRCWLWRNFASGTASVLAVMGGFAFGSLSLQMDRWLDSGLSSLGFDQENLARVLQFVISMVVAGILSIGIQYLASVAARPFWPRSEDDKLSKSPRASK